ncbi:MAG: MgtC/SapB family protein [Candidatus Tectomicrobia bacterium]|nr:MgtC/SapB family protein [Candidatus Tectomicrobia bacterium]
MEQLWTFVRLIEAAFLGGLIGFERERNNQPAGLRTHIILCLGSALIMVVSHRVASGGAVYDPGRIAAQVVSGIGFLGAGAILRMGASVRGLTTAASIWTTSGIGLAVGAGMHAEAISATAILLLSLAALKRVGRRITGRLRFRRLVIEVRQEDEEILQEIEDILSKERCNVRSMEVKKHLETGTFHVQVEMSVPRDFDPAHLLEALTRNPYVIEADVR